MELLNKGSNARPVQIVKTTVLALFPLYYEEIEKSPYYYKVMHDRKVQEMIRQQTAAADFMKKWASMVLNRSIITLFLAVKFITYFMIYLLLASEWMAKKLYKLCHKAYEKSRKKYLQRLI